MHAHYESLNDSLHLSRPTIKKPKEKIPELYSTEKKPFEKKIIYQRYQMKDLGFYWLIAELDKKKNLAFGYANLNNDVFAEWGYISIDELLENGAELDDTWKPCVYTDAMKLIAEEGEKAKSREDRWGRIYLRF